MDDRAALDERTIEVLEERLRSAMLQSNVAELDALLSPELVFTTFLGELISKDLELRAHESGYVQMHSIKLADTASQFVGEVAIVTCCAEIDATFDGDRSCKQFRFTRVWAPVAGGSFHVVAGQATLVYESL